MVKGYWKRCVVLVTDSVHKYRYDPFFRTEASIIVLQGAFALLVLFVLGAIAQELNHDTSVALSSGINTAVFDPHATPAVIANAIVENLRSMRSRTVVLAAGAVVVVTIVFTYIIMRLALSPTRNALTSQKRFIGNVAHELRTPLAVSKTNLEVALMNHNLDSSLKHSLESTVEELDRASGIINNLLSLSASIRPERIEFSDVDLGIVMSDVTRKLRDFVESKHLELEVRMSERRNVWGNMIALEQIMMNILKNAISFTSNHGRIRITIEPVHPDFIEFTIQDSGKGIAREHLFKIFEPYYQADPSRKRRDGGSGLGLTIVSELVKLHNGKISVRSAEGRGTTVTVLLPAGKKRVGLSGSSAIEHDTASEIAVDFSRGNREV